MGCDNRLQKALILAAVAVLILAGCAGAPIDKTLQTEELLGTAGFQLKMADTPTKFERISRIPQKQVVRGMVKGREVYVWADAAGCRCFYAGTRQNYGGRWRGTSMLLCINTKGTAKIRSWSSRFDAPKT